MPVIQTRPLNERTLLVTLNRPESYNALIPELLTEFIAVMQDVCKSRQWRSVVITGAGKAFCSGADLKFTGGPGSVPGTEGMNQVGFIYKYQELLSQCILAIHECDKPVISAVNGVAVGGGFSITLASDVRVASTAAKFGAVFIKTGLSSCDVGSSYFLPRLVPPGIAMELMASGRIFSADEAQRIGLVNRLVEPDQLLGSALELAESFNENSEYGVWMTKKGFWNNIDAPSLRHAMEIENRTQVLGVYTGCVEESAKAFAEKRKPQWKPL